MERGSSAMNESKSSQIHSKTNALDDGRLSAPSALRNMAPICKAMANYVPAGGRALEIASGSGQHVVTYARTFANVVWQPSDIAPDRLASINAWAAAEAGDNLLPAKLLDASVADWNAGAFDFVIMSNLFHLISEAAASQVIAGISRATNPGGRVFIYGPFRTDGGFRSEGDAAFHRQITANDPQAGYKHLEWMQEHLLAMGLTEVAELEMPANNLSLVWQK